MSRSRTVKPEFWINVQLLECHPMARFLFIGLWSHADDNGIIPCNYRQLKLQIFPGDDSELWDGLITIPKIEQWVGELRQNKLVAAFMYESTMYLHIIKWKKHQYIQKPFYRYPTYWLPEHQNKAKLLDQLEGGIIPVSYCNDTETIPDSNHHGLRVSNKSNNKSNNKYNYIKKIIPDAGNIGDEELLSIIAEKKTDTTLEAEIFNDLVDCENKIKEEIEQKKKESAKKEKDAKQIAEKKFYGDTLTLFQNQFRTFYKQQKGYEYSWDAKKDNPAVRDTVKRILDTLHLKWDQATPTQMTEKLYTMLSTIADHKDHWIYSNLDMRVINSKYNQIIDLIKNGKSNPSSTRKSDNASAPVQSKPFGRF